MRNFHTTIWNERVQFGDLLIYMFIFLVQLTTFDIQKFWLKMMKWNKIQKTNDGNFSKMLAHLFKLCGKCDQDKHEDDDVKNMNISRFGCNKRKTKSNY